MVTAIYGFDVTPQVDRYVKPDGWTFGSRLADGGSFSPFRLPTNSGGPIKSLAVNVETTGRTLQRVQGERMVRVRITFIGDGEPDTVSGGWMAIA
jgi:hypothetical protein